MGVLNRYMLTAFAGCTYALIVFPMLLLSCGPSDSKCLLEPRPENRIVWPIVGCIALFQVAQGWSRLRIPPHILSLLALLAFCGVSFLWAYKPDISMVRFSQEALIISSIVLPALLADRRADLLHVLFVCFAVAALLNIPFVMGGPPKFGENATPGYTGYFAGKNYLGEFAAIALFLSVYECSQSGARRVVGAIVLIISLVLLFLSNSKTALALAVVVPVLSVVLVAARAAFRLSPAVLPWAIVIGYMIVNAALNVSVYRLSYIIYGESTFTGRKLIWDFALSEVARRPFLGWGYQSFWLVGPDAPSVVEAPGWVAAMPNAHNGYIDNLLETGAIGFILLLIFLTLTLHASGRLVDQNRPRGLLVVTLIIYIMAHNGLESNWMRAFEFPWIAFLFLVAEIGRVRPEMLVRMAGPVSLQRPQRLPSYRSRRVPRRGQHTSPTAPRFSQRT